MGKPRNISSAVCAPLPARWTRIRRTAPSPEGPVRVKALMSALADGSGAPGTVLDEALTVACGQDGEGGAVRLIRVQRAGKGAQSAQEMLRGFPIAVGTVLG